MYQFVYHALLENTSPSTNLSFMLYDPNNQIFMIKWKCLFYIIIILNIIFFNNYIVKHHLLYKFNKINLNINLFKNLLILRIYKNIMCNNLIFIIFI